MNLVLRIFPALWAASLTLGTFIGCTDGGITDPGDNVINLASRGITPTRIVLTVYYENSAAVVVTTAENPAASKVISPPGNFGRPSFSPTLDRVAFKDFDDGYEYIFDEVTDSAYQAFAWSAIGGSPTDLFPILPDSNAVLWNRYGTNIYYTRTPYSRYWGVSWYMRSALGFNVDNGNWGQLTRSYIPLARMEDARLAGIGFGYNSVRSLVLYDLRKPGKVKLTSPYLYYDAGGSKPGYFFEEADWSDELELFVLSCYEQGMHDKARYLAVTDLDGTFFLKLTSGDHTDINPRWAPNGPVTSRWSASGTIIFQRYDNPIDAENQINSSILELNLDTQEIRELISKEDYTGSVGVGSFDI